MYCLKLTLCLIIFFLDLVEFYEEIYHNFSLRNFWGAEIFRLICSFCFRTSNFLCSRTQLILMLLIMYAQRKEISKFRQYLLSYFQPTFVHVVRFPFYCEGALFSFVVRYNNLVSMIFLLTHWIEVPFSFPF